MDLFPEPGSAVSTAAFSTVLERGKSRGGLSKRVGRALEFKLE